MLVVAIIYSNEFIVKNGYSEQTLNYYFLLLPSELLDYWFQTYLTTELGQKIFFVVTHKLAPKFGTRYVTSFFYTIQCIVIILIEITMTIKN